MAKMSLSNASLDELRKEIQRRQAALPALIAQRDELDRKIHELQALGQVAAAPAKVRRAGRKVSLAKLLGKLLADRPGQSVNELAEAALAAGHGTKSKSFKTVVRKTLYRDRRFKTVGIGKFAAKG